MSKFIRTKEGIYETRENGETCNGFGCKSNNGTIKIHKKDILKQADTIEELCDKFVITFNDKSIEPKQFKIFETALEELNKCDSKYYPVLKGAIWTDKGLIYVAKLNDKGDLELI